jgi:tetratricopeptide (TPR) repeat protein
MIPRLLVAALVLGAPPAAADNAIEAHLLAGARAFRAQKYEAALAEFREVERAGGTPDLPLYLGPTLYKAGRIDEARVVLDRMHRSGQTDAVAEYYLGLCWYRLGLVRLARALFSTIDSAAAGPKLAEGASRFIADIDARSIAPASVASLLATAETLEHAQPAAALDDAEEAFLRAPPGLPERMRAASLVVRLSAIAGTDDVVRRAAAEQSRPTP